MKTITNLKHTIRHSSDGAMILILDTGALIDPESSAMIQALHSRSIGGILSHLKTLASRGPANFMKNFYVGYGHKSIGDCGNITIFVEGVSMLVAKAIQSSRLYNGQESSTRYIDFETQPFFDPIGTEESHKFLEKIRSFYVDSMPKVIEDLKKKFSKEFEEDHTLYEKAIKARAFDILRGFLPAGATTNLAWSTNLRQAADHIAVLRNHPLQEVRNVADTIESALEEAYPNSFGHKRYEKTEDYTEKTMKKHYYYDNDCPSFALVTNNVSLEDIEGYKEDLSERPPKTELPAYFANFGNLRYKFLLDFGSFRDIQRHRSVAQRMPLLTTNIGFERWYLDELPFEVEIVARALLPYIETACKEGFLKDLSEEERQYFIPMGYLCSCDISGDLRALTYIVELRATRFVHKTLRTKMKLLAENLLEIFGRYEMVLHLDNDMDRFDIARGKHDITLKKK